MYNVHMALHMNTDEDFDRALEWLAREENRSKSDVIRDAVISRYRARRGGFAFGGLAHLKQPGDTARTIRRQLGQVDRDDELD